MRSFMGLGQTEKDRKQLFGRYCVAVDWSIRVLRKSFRVDLLGEDAVSHDVETDLPCEGLGNGSITTTRTHRR
jgi:hypothetical protein